MEITNSKTSILHNPRCSKSRQTLAILEEKGENPQIIEYLKTPPSIKELTNILTSLNISPRELMRKGEAEYKEFNIADESLTDSELITIMHNNPRLIERPIVLKDGKIAVGRPPENVLTIL